MTWEYIVLTHASEWICDPPNLHPDPVELHGWDTEPHNPTVGEMLNIAGSKGWELVKHDLAKNGHSWHDRLFMKRSIA